MPLPAFTSLRLKPRRPAARPVGMRRALRLAVSSTLLPLALSLTIASCAHPGTATPAATAAPTLQGDAAHPAATQAWVRTELYFGLGPADQPDQGISEAQWRDFLDREVTPRFPSGLSTVNLYGQWQGKDESEPSRLRSKVLIILYPATQENKAKIDAVRAAWKQLTGDQSVLRVTQPADVSF